MASLWPVLDTSTADLMTGFHGACRSGTPPAKALARAAEGVRSRHSHSYHWGAFIVVGVGWEDTSRGWRPVPVPRWEAAGRLALCPAGWRTASRESDVWPAVRRP
ncbi:CHAT domain-containing protein [Streptomyces coeruleoprunus]|uniref:CHAT domain-containing protein n=1 Tax=Streptomyces coeruleoprunus TaxID=285563 RepID=A0ABV9XID0_9ACTN